jgi:hypothetical protein
MLNHGFSPAEDNATQAEKLDKYSGEVDWGYLRPHFEAGNLLYVDPCLDLKTAGLALTNDDQAQVKKWLHCGDLVQPCELHAEHWEKEKTLFQAMIVRPFILAQPIQ